MDAVSPQQKIERLRERVKLLAAFGPIYEEVAKVEDVAIPARTGIVPARLYHPSIAGHRTNGLPALVFYHGGGFAAGDLDSYDHVLRSVANRAECIVMSVDYHLAPEHQYPAAPEDAWDALIWLRDNAGAMGANFRKLAVGGDSAGGLLAASVAQRALHSEVALCLQVLLYPGLDATMSMPSWKQFGAGDYLISYAQMAELLDAYLPAGLDRAAPEVSPLFCKDLRGIAPAFLVVGDHDPLCDECEQYAANLKAQDVPVTYICWPGMIHAFASLAGVLDAGEVLLEKTAAALRQAFE